MIRTKEDFKKINLRNASYAHITQEKISIWFKGKQQGASVEYQIDFENNGAIHIPLKENVKSYYVSGSVVRYLKDITQLSHYEKNDTEACKKLGIRMDSIYAHTKKGDLSFDRFIKPDGRPLNCADIEAIYC